MASIRSFRPEDREGLVALWTACGLVVPQNDPRHDLDLKAGEGPELLLVAELGGAVVGSVMAGWDGHRGRLNYVAVHPDAQRQGLGRALVAEAEQRLKALGCPKINLEVRNTNAAVLRFYEKLGYSDNQVLSLGKRL